MSEDRYRGGGADWQREERRGTSHGTPRATEMRYATQGRRRGNERRDDRTNDERPGELSPLMEIARYDERHHFGRHSIERRQEEQARRQTERDEETRRRMRREQRGRSYGGERTSSRRGRDGDRRRGPQSRS